jgi:dolichol-phosphate mannosyltransferase
LCLRKNGNNPLNSVMNSHPDPLTSEFDESSHPLLWKTALVAELSAFQCRNSQVALIIPIWNEGKNIVHQLERIRDAAVNIDIILCDTRSTDGSTSKQRLRGLGVRTLLVTDQIGLGTALRLGIGYALDEGYEGVITMDGNGKDGVHSIPQFQLQLANGYDFIQGSRFIAGGENRHTPLDRYLGIRLFIVPLIRIATGYPYTDVTNGFKGMSSKFLRDSRVQPLRPIFQHFNLQFFLNYIAPRLEFKVLEIPVSRNYPTKGPTPTKIIGVKRKLLLVRQLFETIIGWYNCRETS